MTKDQQLPITALIIQRSNELGWSRAELVRRSGYTNISKGLRRLDELCDGDFRSARGLIQALPTALEVSSDVVAKAVEDTRFSLLRCMNLFSQVYKCGFRFRLSANFEEKKVTR